MAKQHHAIFNLNKMLHEPRVSRSQFLSHAYQGMINRNKIMKVLKDINHPVEVIPSHLWRGGLRRQQLSLRKGAALQ